MLKNIIIISICIAFASCSSKQLNGDNNEKTYKDTITQIEAVARFLENRELYMPGTGTDSAGAESTRTGTNLYWYRGIVGKGNIDGNYVDWAQKMSEGYEVYKSMNDTTYIMP